MFGRVVWIKNDKMGEAKKGYRHYNIHRSRATLFTYVEFNEWLGFVSFYSHV